jgi:hypothetical protein
MKSFGQGKETSFWDEKSVQEWNIFDVTSFARQRQVRRSQNVLGQIESGQP